VGGESGGAFMAINLNLMARDRKLVRIAYQLILYPGIFQKIEPMLKPIYRLYLPDPSTHSSPYLNPLLDSGKDIPPTLVVTCEFDQVKSHGIRYYEFIKKMGVDVVYKNYNSTHNFLSIGTPETEQAFQDITNEINKKLQVN